MVSDKDKPRIGLMSPTHTMDTKPNESHSFKGGPGRAESIVSNTQRARAMLVVGPEG